MKFDFSVPITFYEFLAIILSTLAVLIPIIKWGYEKFVKKLKFSFMPSGTISLYHNRSGSYLHLGGVYDAKNKPAIVKEISVNVIRESDKATLSLIWSTLPSPVYRNVGGNYESSFETAHPFKVSADTLEPVFIEFSNRNENMDEKTDAILFAVHSVARIILAKPNINPFEADQHVKKSDEANTALIKLNDIFFWKAGTYELQLVTLYNDTCLRNTYQFTITDDESSRLRRNIESMLIIPVAEHFNTRAIFNTVRKDFKEKV